MDRESLARRNQRVARAIRRRPLKHRLRNGLLKTVASMPVSIQGGESNRILIIRPDHLGDMLLTTPAIKAIKAQRPERQIHVLCGDWSAELLSHFEEVDQVLTLAFPGFRRDAAGGSPYRLALHSARRLRRIGYDSAMIMRPDHWWGALVAFLAGIPQRVGYDAPGVTPFLTMALALEHQHAVEQNLRLAGAMTREPRTEETRLDFPLQSTDRDAIDARLSARGIAAGAPLICIHPGSGAASKLWLAEKWASVADALEREYQAAIVFTGTAGDLAMIEDIASKMQARAQMLAGETSVGDLAALYERSLLVLGPDSGAMHVAAAVHCPTVALFGPADPAEFAPWGVPRRQAVVTSDIGCRPCRILDWRGDRRDYHPCVRDIAVERVLAEARRVLDSGRR